MAKLKKQTLCSFVGAVSTGNLVRAPSLALINPLGFPSWVSQHRGGEECTDLINGKQIDIARFAPTEETEGNIAYYHKTRMAINERDLVYLMLFTETLPSLPAIACGPCLTALGGWAGWYGWLDCTL